MVRSLSVCAVFKVAVSGECCSCRSCRSSTLIVDALAEKDGISWVWKGSTALPRKRDPMSDNGRIVTRALLSLSRGGSDASHVKEFDMITQDFVPDEEAFQLPEAKSRASYKSRDILLVGSDFGANSLTSSGYPRVLKEWERGTKIEDAPIVFEGEHTDVAISGFVADERNWGGSLWQIHSRSITFYTSKYWMAKLTEDHLLPLSQRPSGLAEPDFKQLDIQEDAEMDMMGKMLFISLRSDWTPKDDGKAYKCGSVIYCQLDKFLNEGKASVDYEILFEPTERTAYEYFTCTKNYLVLSTMDNVKSKLHFFKLGGDGTSLTLIPGDSEAQIRDCNVRPLDPIEGDEFWFTTSSYTQPSTLYLADAGKVETSDKTEDVFISETFKKLPSQYDSADLIVEQRTAVSEDGTDIPYFIVMKKDVELNGKNPTLLYGYGGKSP
jgi:prolyl oligopeptidase